jgi:cyclase
MATSAQARTGTIEIADGVYAFIQEAGATNAGFIIGDEGVLVIDALMTAALAQKLMAEVRRVTTKPIRFLVYTHFHGDHTFGGVHFLPAAIIGHKECREELIEKWGPSVERFATMRPEFAEEFRSLRITPPDIVFTERLTVYLGGRRIELLYLGRAHTRGDVFVYLPKERVLFAGDVVVNGRVPAAMDAYITSWTAVLEQAQSLAVDVLVPGHGLLGDKQTIAEQHAFLTELKQQVRQRFEAGKSAEETAAELQFPQFASWPNIGNLSVPVQRLYLEFRGQL